MPSRIPTFRPGRRLAPPTMERRDGFYRSVPWRKLRAWFMGQPENALCAECRRWGRLTPAVICDHILPRQSNPGRELDPTNLQALCRACDNRKRARDVATGAAGAGARGRGSSGSGARRDQGGA